MVYLAVGVLVATLSVTIYTYRSSKPPQLYLLWRGKDEAAIGSSEVGKQDHSLKQDSIPTFTLDDGEGDTAEAAPAPKQIPGTAPNCNMKPAVQPPPPPLQNKAPMPPPVHTILNAKRKADKHVDHHMPRPSRPSPTTTTTKTPPKPSTALRPPPSAASTLRGPPLSSLKASTLSLAPSISTLAPSARPSKKVLLDPGHSPLDWAHLTANPPTATFLRGADVPPNLIRVPPSALRYHTGRKGKDAWGVYQGKVYNMSPYMKFHPGGVDQMMRGAGKEKEGEKLFNEIHPWVSWENMLGECLVGILVSENEAHAVEEDGGSQMDEMD